MVVNIVKWVSGRTEDEPGHHEVMHTFTLKDGKVTCTSPELLKYLYRERIRNVVGKKPDEFLTPDDGELFMQNLSAHFRDPRCMAMEVW